jgi:hypothetical protein
MVLVFLKDTYHDKCLKYAHLFFGKQFAAKMSPYLYSD